MTIQPFHLVLACPSCEWAESAGPGEMDRWLRSLGMLRRNREPSAEEMRELLLSAAGRLTCEQCGHSGLVAADDPDDDADWPEPRRCQSCGGEIAAERLEVFPEAELCVACQQREDRGIAPSTGEYCPSCGSPMVVRTTTGAGITRNALVCSDSRCRRR